MIHKLENNRYGISSFGVWRPGSFDSEKTAKYATRFSDEVILKIQDSKNKSGEPISYDDLKNYKK